MLPHVILHNQVSVDGRIDGFAADLGLHYELASRWEFDAHLAGCDTLLQAQGDVPPEVDDAFEPPVKKPDDPRPLLVVPDSRGRLRNWHHLRKQPYWRDMIALCANVTPRDYLEYLQRRHITCIVAGEDHVHLSKALEELNAGYGVETILVDSGGTLDGVLLRAGLVDEVSLLIHPSLVGGTTQRSMFRGPDLAASEGVIQLSLTHLEKLNNDFVWLRYEVKSKQAA